MKYEEVKKELWYMCQKRWACNTDLQRQGDIDNLVNEVWASGHLQKLKENQGCFIFKTIGWAISRYAIRCKPYGCRNAYEVRKEEVPKVSPIDHFNLECLENGSKEDRVLSFIAGPTKPIDPSIQIEQKDLLEHILEKVKAPQKEWDAAFSYFIEGKQQKEIARERGYERATISLQIKKFLQRCREVDMNKELKIMGKGHRPRPVDHKKWVKGWEAIDWSIISKEKKGGFAVAHPVTETKKESKNDSKSNKRQRKQCGS